MPPRPTKRCPTCGGLGHSVRRTAIGLQGRTTPVKILCPTCNGARVVPAEPGP